MSQTDEKQLSIQELRELLVCYDGGNLEYISKHRAAQVLNISRRTLKMLLDNRTVIEEGRRDANVRGNDSSRETHHQTKRQKKNRYGLIDDVEIGLFGCYQETINSNLPADNEFLLDKAKSIAAQLGVQNFVPTVTWLMHWKYKNNIPLEHVSAVPRTDFNVSAAKKCLNDLLKYALANYRADDVYGLVETGLYYHQDDSNADFDCSGCDKLVQRVSVIFICNITGTDKKQPLVIDKRPGVQGTARPFSGDATNSNALMTSYYTSSLLQWDREIGPRKILLVLDNRSVHPTLHLRNIDIKYLPKPFPHPLGQNIVRIAKTYEQYRSAVPPPFVNAAYGPTVQYSWEHTTSEYLNMLSVSWAEISPELIQHCFRIIGFTTTDLESKVKTLALTVQVDRGSNGNRKRRRSSKSSDVDGSQFRSEKNQVHPLDLTKNYKSDGQFQGKIENYGDNILTPIGTGIRGQ